MAMVEALQKGATAAQAQEAARKADGISTPAVTTTPAATTTPKTTSTVAAPYDVYTTPVASTVKTTTPAQTTTPVQSTYTPASSGALNANSLIPGTQYTFAQYAALFGNTSAQEYLNKYNNGGYQAVLDSSSAGVYTGTPLVDSGSAGTAAQNAAIVALKNARNAVINNSATPITWVGADGKTYTAAPTSLTSIGESYSPSTGYTTGGATGTASAGASGTPSTGSPYADLLNSYTGGSGNGAVAQSGAQYSNEYEAIIKSLADRIMNYGGFESGAAPTWDDQYQAAYNAALQEVLNRAEFSYDKTTDPVYQSYVNEYTREGNLALEDVLARSSIASGGLSSSAVLAAQQAQDYYSSQMADKIPELYTQAYNRYLDEFNMDRAALSDVTGARTFDYGTYRDSVSDFQTDRAFNYSDYLNQYDMLNNSLSNYQGLDNTDYSRYLDQIAQMRQAQQDALAAQQQALENSWTERAYQSSADQSNWENAYKLMAAGMSTEQIASTLGVSKADVDDMFNKASADDNWDKAYKLMAAGLSTEQIASVLGVTKADIDAMAKAASKSSGSGSGGGSGAGTTGASLWQAAYDSGDASGYLLSYVKSNYNSNQQNSMYNTLLSGYNSWLASQGGGTVSAQEQKYTAARNHSGGALNYFMSDSDTLDLAKKAGNTLGYEVEDYVNAYIMPGYNAWLAKKTANEKTAAEAAERAYAYLADKLKSAGTMTDEERGDEAVRYLSQLVDAGSITEAAADSIMRRLGI
jgi:predicted XRE-type DNA-binding protein